MAVETLRLDGVQVGDLVLRYAASSAPVTPPVVQSGVWRDTARIDAASRNMLYGLRVWLHIARATHHACAAAVAAVQARAHWRGAVQVVSSALGVRVLTDDDWVLMDVAAPTIEPGYGGRICTDWELSFAGQSPAIYYG